RCTLRPRPPSPTRRSSDLASGPPIAEAARQSVFPETIDLLAIVTIVGGTVGGYITFAGAHRLLDAGVHGPDALGKVTRSAYWAIDRKSTRLNSSHVKISYA